MSLDIFKSAGNKASWPEHNNAQLSLSQLLGSGEKQDILYCSVQSQLWIIGGDSRDYWTTAATNWL